MSDVFYIFVMFTIYGGIYSVENVDFIGFCWGVGICVYDISVFFIFIRIFYGFLRRFRK